MSQVQLSSNIVNIIKTQNGEDGLNQATIFLYQRAASQPSVPQSDVTYTFSTGVITGNIGSWSQSMPAKNSNPCWITTAVTISREDQDTIYSSDWKQSEKLAEDGVDGTSVSITSTSHVGNTTTVNFSDGTSITIDDGADGKGIQSIVEYYKTSSSDDTPPTGTWYTTLQVPDANNPYLWNYEYITYTDGNDGETSKRIIGTYSAPGTPGADGKGIANIINYYAKTAGTTAPQIGSQDWIACPPGTIPVLDETDKYLWNYEHTVYTDSTTSDTTPHIISMFAKDGVDGKDGKDGADVNQYTIHTNAQEILKFIITQPVNGKYQFSLDELRINGYDIKNQIIVPNIEGRINNQICKYSILDVNIINYNLKEIIKESSYDRYVEIKQNDTDQYYFNLGTLYQDSIGTVLKNNLNTSFTEAEKNEIVKNIQEFFNNDLNSVDIIVYGQVIEQDFIKVNIDSTAFNENKTLFYTKTVQSGNIVIYAQCTDSSIFDPNTEYYTQKLTEYNIEKYISVKNGLSSEMLAFSVNAGSINAAIQSTKLKFNENGLTITNGGIRIYTDDEVEGKEVFRIETGSDSEKHLYLNGSGVFTGTIYAQGGEFTGTVHAQNGEFNGTVNASGGSIGGFTIDSDSIYAGNDKQNSPLLLQSSNGSLINVDNIQIGTGAKIKDYLEIGNLKLLNPDLYSNVMELMVEDQNYFSLTNTGDILGKNWSITKDENGFVTANFGNLIAQDGVFTGEITASVINATTLNSINFVTENVRAMGGAFIFKPTFKITSITPQGSNIVDFILELSENDKNYFNLDLTNEYIISISGKDTHIGKINNIDLSTNKVSVYFKNADYNIFVTDGTIANYQTLTLFGQATVDALIGINSDDNWTGDIMPPRALIMEEFTALTETSSGFGDIDYTPKLLLGNLAPLRQYNISGLENITGYGLYADNVFLRGSLTTSGGNSYNYAGVNTQGPISFNYNSWNTNGATTTPSSQYSDDKIIFWGGAAGVQSSQIQVSPFIVTDKGNIFARSGEFKGSVISDSLITNTIIKAPVIYGNNSQREGHEGEPSLKIYNTDTSTGGIGFYKQVGQIDEERSGIDQDDILTLSISTNGFTHFNNEFISFNENNGNIIFTGTKYVVNNTELRDKELVNEASSIYFNQTNDSKLKLDYNSQRGIEITKDQIINYGGYTVNEGIVEIKTVIQNNTTKTLKYYVNSENYYCLMVS